MFNFFGKGDKKNFDVKNFNQMEKTQWNFRKYQKCEKSLEIYLNERTVGYFRENIIEIV